ncbi:hypothetical protein SCHPADRAFT_939849 [Schizopora paradoxa]|uniref:Uncharacterized protein n=1 Tax=Schizopora paradoxa TaxID=27342 RepID=A0A0H2RR49_9AGAM|nr:hypothetical protein SCHPADRAFT_939849 [Schizopora paradoxa]
MSPNGRIPVNSSSTFSYRIRKDVGICTISVTFRIQIGRLVGQLKGVLRRSQASRHFSHLTSPQRDDGGHGSARILEFLIVEHFHATVVRTEKEVPRHNRKFIFDFSKLCPLPSQLEAYCPYPRLPQARIPDSSSHPSSTPRKPGVPANVLDQKQPQNSGLFIYEGSTSLSQLHFQPKSQDYSLSQCRAVLLLIYVLFALTITSLGRDEFKLFITLCQTIDVPLSVFRPSFSLTQASHQDDSGFHVIFSSTLYRSSIQRTDWPRASHFWGMLSRA